MVCVDLRLSLTAGLAQSDVQSLHAVATQDENFSLWHNACSPLAVLHQTFHMRIGPLDSSVIELAILLQPGHACSVGRESGCFGK